MQTWLKILILIVVIVVVVNAAGLLFVPTALHEKVTQKQLPQPTNQTVIGLPVMQVAKDNVTSAATVTTRMITVQAIEQNGARTEVHLWLTAVTDVHVMYVAYTYTWEVTVTVWITNIFNVKLAKLQVDAIWATYGSNGTISGYQNPPGVYTQAWWPWSVTGSSGSSSVLVKGSDVLAHGQATYIDHPYLFTIETVTLWANIQMESWGGYSTSVGQT